MVRIRFFVNSKVATNLRQKYLESFFFEFKRVYARLPETEFKAIIDAVRQEKDLFAKAQTKTVYVNLAANALRTLKQRAVIEAAGASPEDDIKAGMGTIEDLRKAEMSAKSTLLLSAPLV